MSVIIALLIALVFLAVVWIGGLVSTLTEALVEKLITKKEETNA